MPDETALHTAGHLEFLSPEQLKGHLAYFSAFCMERLSSYMFFSAFGVLHAQSVEAQGQEKGHLDLSPALGRARVDLSERQEDTAMLCSFTG